MWEKVKLGEICKIRTGKLDVNAENPTGLYPFFTCSKNHTYIDDYAFNEEAIIVAGNGDLNVKYYKGKFNAYQRTYVINPFNNINGKFLFYFLDQYVSVLRNESIGGVIKYIKLGNLTEALIPLPPLHIQEKIAEILDKADELRRKDQELQDKYDQLAQAIFIDMFGDYLNSSNNCLLDFIELNPKKSEINEEKKLEVSFIPMASVGENGQLNLSQTKIIEDVYSGFTYFREDDVLFAKITPCMENGKGAIARNLKNKIGFGSTEFHVLRPTKQLTSTLIYYLLSLKHIRKFAEINMSGSAGQKRVPASFFSKINLNAPPIHL